ncbi:hypothetical protein QR680_013837 [Steinernema hermaphroditum]|uniref:Uncharacterized protein n=1 Tax=Steinernema hermaphroditum TaxID=289476 RepID=A0AA39M363_9BILA|nr:hypothetical protein QR680_013837 [Steinernema hermaphroditum]
MKTVLVLLLLVLATFCFAEQGVQLADPAPWDGCEFKGVGLQGPVHCDAAHPLCRVFNNGIFLCCKKDIPGTPHCN